LILIAHHTQKAESFVLKLLRPYEDTRYHLKTCAERQQFQLEAFRQNCIFTPGVSLGLARIQAFDPANLSLSIDDFLPYPASDEFSQEREYALVMRQLPDERRLDCLLEKQCEPILQGYARCLAHHAVFLHTHSVEVLSAEEQAWWGSSRQLEEKLDHNLALLDLVPAQRDRCGQTYRYLKPRLRALQKALTDVFACDRFRGYFERRVAQHCIKHCHGDLKSSNMWIMLGDRGWDNAEQVCVLDAADFNPAYTRIDILSDIALLAADIQTRTRLPALADLFLDTYLQCMGQQDDTAAAVLAYYLVEKAVVGAAISLVYDNLPELGLAFLETAEMRVDALKKRS
jgi:aminoglycoside phosphotransferase family enzyme